VRQVVKETVGEYAKRWLASRKDRVRSNGTNRAHLETHILPVLGLLDVRAIVREDVERLVDKLDSKMKAGTLSAKTAKNIWGTCTRLFRDATYAKPASGLRCLTVDPTDKVRGPDDDGEDKLLQFLYPSEFSQFMACKAVPRLWRRNAAIATYLGLRDGEQRALKWPAVDLEHGMVHVSETFDRQTGEERGGTKSSAGRTVPIPPELVPLLAAMKKQAKGKGSVCPRDTTLHLARDLRRWLVIAGVDREQLHQSTSTNKPMRWHDLRATTFTWMAVRGDSATAIRDVAGHTQTSMTDRYMRAATMLRSGRFGEVFPPLPDPSDLVSSGFRPRDDKTDLTTCNYSGGAGNRTRVRKRLAPASTCVSDELVLLRLAPVGGLAPVLVTCLFSPRVR
jgi:integrase